MSKIGVCSNCKHPVWLDVDGDGRPIEVSLCTLKLMEMEIIETGEMNRCEYHSHAFNALSDVMIRMCIGDGATRDEIIREMKISPTIVDWLINFLCAVDFGMQEQHRPLYKSFRVTDTSTTYMVDVFIGHGKWAPVERDNLGD